jgi:hypothetical protein
MSLHKFVFLSLILSLFAFGKSYNQLQEDSKKASSSIKHKIKKDFTIPTKVDHKSTLKPKKSKPKKIKKDRGMIL